MNKNSKQVKSVKRGPGRPKYTPKFPRSLRFTFGDLCVTNGVNPDTLKGDNCTGLTLRKYLKRDKARKGKSNIVMLKGQFGKPDSKDGLGKPPFLYCLRERLADAGVTPAAKSKASKKPLAKAKASSVTVPLATVPDAAPVVDAVSTATKDYEAQKAALLATPVPVVAISTPAPTPAPDAAPVADTAEVAAAVEVLAAAAS
jgi:hypothetical protein